MRTAGDIDLVVPAKDFSAALETLYTWAEETGEITIELHHSKERPDASRRKMNADVRAVNIDLHRDTYWDSSPSPDALQHARRILVKDDVDIRVLRPKDNLRQMSFHYLWHGATRLLRLCDIALVLESRPANFDWDRCLGTNPVRANWVITAVGLAHHLAGAQIGDTPIANHGNDLADWLLPVAKRQVVLNQPPLGAAFMDAVSNPKLLPQVLRARWWDPISATVWLPARFDSRSRLPIQISVYVKLIGRYGVKRLIPHTGRRLLRKLAP